MMWGFVLFNNARLMKADQFLEGFDKLREQKRFGQLKIIFEANYAATVFDDYLDTDRSLNIVGYTMGGRMTRLYACEWNYYVNALTGLCSTVGFFEVFDKILKQSNSEKLACFDLFAEHRKFISEMPFVDAPNIYGRQELAGQSIGTFYGKKGKRQAGKTEQNEERNSSAKDMIANSVKNGRTVEDFVLDKYISSAEERNYVKSTVPKIVAKVIKGTSIKERDFNERRINKLSEKKMRIYEDIVYTVKDNCFKDQKLFILTVQPFEQLAILVDMDVSFDQIEKAVKSVCLKDK